LEAEKRHTCADLSDTQCQELLEWCKDLSHEECADKFQKARAPTSEEVCYY
jgi:hypothetical protein